MKEEKKVEVKQSQLDEMMAKIERLEKASSKQRLANVDAKTKKETGTSYGLRMIDGKVVISWSDMIENTVEKNPITGAWKENQKVELTYEDGKKEKMLYVTFSRRYTLLSSTLKKKIKDDDGTTFVVETEDGKEYKILDKFVN